MSSKLSFTDINSWYTSLNTLKNKENINLGSETAPNLNQAQIRATDINTYINKLNALRTNEYFRHADWITITTVSSKDQIRDILKQNINTEIANLDKVCANFSVTTSNATFGFKTSFSAGGCSTNITDATTRCNTNQTSSCKTNGTTCGTDGTITQFVFSDRGRTTGRCGITFFTGGNATSSRTTFSTNSDSTCSTNFTNSTSTDKTLSDNTITTTYNFSVVSDKPIISNSKYT